MSKTLSTQEAVKEARRCLNCVRPSCVTACPIENNIPGFIRALGEGNFGSAYEIICEQSSLPAVCGRVCPHERLCEAQCVLTKKKSGLQIGSLEKFIADFAHANDLPAGKPTEGLRGKIAVVGSGPAGLTVAGDLVKMDFDVTIFEAQGEPGGMLLFGIPEFRLRKQVVRREIQELINMGVNIETQKLAGKDFTVDDLFLNGFDAIFMGVGSALPRTLDIPGKELSGILTAAYFLSTVTLANDGKLDDSETVIHPGDNVVIIGAGNVALHAARTAAERGARNVTVVYHKDEASASAFPEEIRSAAAAGVNFKFLQQPIAYFNKKQLRAVKNIRRHTDVADETKVAGLLLQNIVKTAEGAFINEGGQEVLPCDCVILAIGQKPAARIVAMTKGIEVNTNGYVITRDDPYGMTTRPGVFSSGDVVRGPDTIVLVMQESKKVAQGIARYVDAKKLLASCTE
ncbi:MAG: FAD-dependent oxidoreductase [Acidaminococcaceae bacterium]|nr:FAD-dependent oxidoreductase [Acidaminococcaceae bacterium]